MQFRVQHWDKNQVPTELELRERFFKEGLFPYDWLNEPGDLYPAHTHDYDKVIYVVSGSITWSLPLMNESIET